MPDIVDLKKRAQPRCGNCRFGIRRNETGDGISCMRNPPTLGFVSLVPVGLLPYALDVTPLPKVSAAHSTLEVEQIKSLTEAVTTAKRGPIFFPVQGFPGMDENHPPCGEYKPAELIEKAH